ncbi:MAG: type II secretion system ATPase GspE [Myxococcota bacterium]
MARPPAPPRTSEECAMYVMRRLGEILVDAGHVTADQVNKALATQKAKGGRIGEILVSMEACDDVVVAEALAEQLDYEWRESIDISEMDMRLLDELRLRFTRDNRVLPFKREDGFVFVATDDPLNTEMLDEVRFLVRAEVEPVIVPTRGLTDAINRAFDRKSRDLGDGIADIDEEDAPTEESTGLDIGDIVDGDDEAPIIQFVNSLFLQASRERASDIHVEPGEKELTVRFRVDGVLKLVASPPKRFLSSIVTRIKIMAGLNIAEKRLPQDGRIRIKMAGKDIDIRVATAPMVHGERITMRLLDKSSVLLNVRDIGFAPDQLKTITTLIHQPHGIILVTGPTGSGKTTTLYSCLSEINAPDLNIMTIEDPVEYQLQGINQMQVNAKIDLTFASGLRSYLRHDPDVIMVGEIRDEETAKMAIQASLTGHLVFSTLHTNDAAGAFTRLTDMGVEPFLVSSTIIGTMAQRLVRRLCPSCKLPYQPEPTELNEIGLTMEDLYEKTPEGVIYKPNPDGCDACRNLGYRGRTGIYEMLDVTDPVKRLVMARSDSGTIKREACKQGMRTLREDGALRVLKGETSIAEVLRVTSEGLDDEGLDESSYGEVAI